MTPSAPQRPAGLAGATVDQLHLLLVKRAGKWLGIITLMLGLLSAVAVGAGTPAVHRSFATLVVPSQSLMSITVAFLGVLLVCPVCHEIVAPGSRPDCARRPCSRLLSRCSGSWSASSRPP